MTWSRTPPKQDGYWLRLNAGGGVEIRLVLKRKILWGLGGEEKLTPVTSHKLKGWLWYGPIPQPPKNAERLIKGEGE